MTSLRNFGVGITSMLLTLALAAAIISYIGSGIEIVNSGVPNTQAQANVVVNSFCNIGISNIVVNFGLVAPTQNAITANLIVANNIGNVAGNIIIAGANWLGPSPANFFVSNTYWNPTALAVTSGNQLTLFPTNTDTKLTLPVSYPTVATNNIFFGVSVPGGIASGIYTENVLFKNFCGVSGNSISVNSTFTVNVPGTCYISVSNSLISFGSLNPGSATAVANDEYVTNPGGNANANILVEGSNWTSGANNFYVSNTLWNAVLQSTYTGTPLKLAPANFVDTLIEIPYPPTSNGNNIYFGVGVPPGQAAGTYTSNIYIENQC